MTQRPLLRRLLVLLMVAVCAAAAQASASLPQVPSSGPAEPDAEGGTPQITFKGGVEVVSVAVAVRDAHGRIVRGLQRNDFIVRDSGIPTEIGAFYASDSPISLAVLLDISGSMSVGGNMARAREAVSLAMMNLRQGSDEAALFTFDSQLRQAAAFTSDLDRVRRVSLEGKPWGKTSLYDAVAQASRVVGGRSNRRRALLVISDGVDTGSRMSAAEVSAIASAIDVPVYLLVVANPSDHPGGPFAVIQADSRVAETATLEDLARWTGGDMRIASETTHTARAIGDLFSELRYQYILTLEPGTRAGWHPLDIRTRSKNLIVHARGGYVAGPTPGATPEVRHDR